jgi:prophage maintenance system killer protein
MTKENKIVIYETEDGNTKIDVRLEDNNTWITAKSMSELFKTDYTSVTRHINNIYKEGELTKDMTIAKIATVVNRGFRGDIEEKIDYYNLDMIISLGYRVNSKSATKFRQWTTKILRGHIVNGYTINKDRIQQNYDNFIKAVDEIKSITNDESLELVKHFAKTWFSLDSYDRDPLKTGGDTIKQIKIDIKDITKAINKLKSEQDSDLFAVEREPGNLQSILSNVMQSFGGEDVYKTLEEKAGHLLYFMVKNHPFLDGNKRTGAYVFVWFLQKYKLLNLQKITPETLTALTLFIALSDPKDKGKVVGLVVELMRDEKKEGR